MLSLEFFLQDFKVKPLGPEGKTKIGSLKRELLNGIKRLLFVCGHVTALVSARIITLRLRTKVPKQRLYDLEEFEDNDHLMDIFPGYTTGNINGALLRSSPLLVLILLCFCYIRLMTYIGSSWKGQYFVFYVCEQTR